MFRYYIFCICLFQIVTIVNSYKPLKRAQHTASYADNKIYFLGGSTIEKKYTNGFFYLDVSKPFTLDSDLPIVDLRSNTLIYNHAYAMSVVCGSNKGTIFLFGGEFENDKTPSIFAYNISNPVWLNVNVNDSVSKPMRRRLTTGVCDKNAMLYSFGGSVIVNNVTTFSNDFDIFDTNNHDQLNWSLGSKLNIPPPMDTATATLLPDGRIVYLGENTTEPYKFIGLSEIYIYDTNNGEWSTMVTNGDTPVARAAHTTVLTQDGRIIVYGGVLEDLSPAPDKLLVLNTTVQPFEWSIPNSNNIPSSAPTWRHTATLVGNYMIVAFGYIQFEILSNRIHMLDVSDKDNYKWVTEFTPTNTSPVPSRQPTNLRAIIGITIGSILVIVIGISIIFLCRRNSRNLEIRQHQRQVIEKI